jgi:hypothetical protein
MILLLCAVFLNPQAVSAGARGALLDRFLAPDNPPLVSYRAYRHLAASTRGGRLQAEMDVETSFDAARGFSFIVLGERGSGLIRRHVLLEALLIEQRTAAAAAAATTSLTLANYHFLDASDAGEPLTAIGVRARRKSPMLVNGTLFIHADRADLVRVEGELAERPSFWTKRVTIVRRYDRIAGVHVPVAMESNADIRIVGGSTFTMTYRYVEINGARIEPIP